MRRYRNRGRRRRLQPARHPPRQNLHRSPRLRQLHLGQRRQVSPPAGPPVYPDARLIRVAGRLFILAETKVYLAEIAAEGDPVWEN